MTQRPVFVKQGDARAEVDALLLRLGLTPETGGLHKYFYVTKAGQTVVMTAAPDTPLARALRGQAGWQEPQEPQG